MYHEKQPYLLKRLIIEISYSELQLYTCLFMIASSAPTNTLFGDADFFPDRREDWAISRANKGIEFFSFFEKGVGDGDCGSGKNYGSGSIGIMSKTRRCA